MAENKMPSMDEVALVPLFLGMLHMECPDCEQLSDTINIGIAVHECEDCPQDLYGVVQYDQCHCSFHCVHLASPVARLLDRVEEGDVEFADLCDLVFAHTGDEEEVEPQ
jgi:hypothetical protein